MDEDREPRTFGELLRVARGAGTLRGVAERFEAAGCSVSHTTIARVESGDLAPSAAFVDAAARVFSWPERVVALAVRLAGDGARVAP